MSKKASSFPHYSASDAHLDATEINLLASMSPWSVAGEPNSAAFLEMYQPR